MQGEDSETLLGAVPPPAQPVWKQFAVCGSRFVLPAHYEVIKAIGQGAYGVVW